MLTLLMYGCVGVGVGWLVNNGLNRWNRRIEANQVKLTRAVSDLARQVNELRNQILLDKHRGN